MRKIFLILFVFLSCFVNSQTTYLLDAFEYSTTASLNTAYASSESYGEKLSHDMTSNSLPSLYTATASSTYSTYSAFKAFSYNQVSTDYWQANASTGTIQQYTSTYYVPISYVVEAPSANASTYAPKNWTFQCSPDGSTWTTCGTETNQTAWGDGEQRSYSCSGVVAQYRYFRLNVSANNGGTYLAVGELYVTGGASYIWCETTTKKQGTYSLRGVATANANGNTFTRTVSPTVNLSNVNAIFFHLRESVAGANVGINIHDSGGGEATSNYVITSTDTWVWVKFDISAVTNANKDAIDRIRISINTVYVNTFYVDNFFVCTNTYGFQAEQIYPVTNVINAQ